MNDEKLKREVLRTAETNRTNKTRTTDKTVLTFDMSRAPTKYTIFEMMPGANEKRFLPFNDMPFANSKYEREQVGIVEFSLKEGREKFTTLDPEPLEMQPDYTPNVEYFKTNLRKGAVEFGSMSERRPNMNKTYGDDKTFYTQKKNATLIEYRPTIRRRSV